MHVLRLTDLMLKVTKRPSKTVWKVDMELARGSSKSSSLAIPRFWSLFFNTNNNNKDNKGLHMVLTDKSQTNNKAEKKVTIPRYRTCVGQSFHDVRNEKHSSEMDLKWLGKRAY